MSSVNKVILVGNVGRDPECRYSPDGTAFANLSLATSRAWKDKSSGEKREETEWHRVSFSGRLAEVVSEYVTKGMSLYVEGRLRTRKWQDKDGQDKYTTEIMADQMQMLGGRRESGGEQRATESGTSAPQTHAAAPRRAAGGNFDDMDDDIPF